MVASLHLATSLRFSAGLGLPSQRNVHSMQSRESGHRPAARFLRHFIEGRFPDRILKISNEPESTHGFRVDEIRPEAVMSANRQTPGDSLLGLVARGLLGFHGAVVLLSSSRV
jgi:hypothetical protein